MPTVEVKKREPGLLEQYGLPTTPAEELLKQRQLGRRQEIINMPGSNGGKPSGDDMAWRQLGIMVGSKLGWEKASTLTQEEQAQYAVTEGAQERFNALRNDSPELWRGMSAEDKALTYRRFLADAAEEAGLGDLATTMNEDYVRAYNSHIREKLEQQKMGIDVDDSVEQLTQRRIDNALKNRIAGSGPIYVPFSDDPNSSVLATWDNDGVATYRDPRTGREVTVRPGEYTTARPIEGAKAKDRTVKPAATPSAQQLMRDTAVSLVAQLDVAEVFWETMSNAVEEFGTVDFLSVAGGVANVTQKLVDNVSALARLTKGVAGSDYLPFLDHNNEQVGHLNVYNQSSIDQFLKKKNYLARDMDNMWAQMERNPRLLAAHRSREEWQANVIRLAYARARAREPGARQLSDNDIRYAMAELGAATTDPESFRRVMMQGLGGDIQKWRNDMHFTPQEIKDAAFAPGSLQRMEDRIQRFYDRYGDPDQPRSAHPNFGTAGQPGPGLRRDGGGSGSQVPPAARIGDPDADGWRIVTRPDGSTFPVRNYGD
jgi:hypothetical protein